MKKIIMLFIIPMPWILKRRLLTLLYGYNLHPTARIGFSWIYPSHLFMAPGAKIGHFSTAIHLDEIRMDAKSSIGRNNWITGFSSLKITKHFQHQPDRKSILLMAEGSAITKNHHLDCTSPISIGKFTIIAGYQSQFLTHAIDIIESRQDSNPITIGSYCFVSTNVLILGGSILPDFCVLGAKSLLNKKYEDNYTLYAGLPAVPVKKITKDAKFFLREEAFVY